VQNARLVKQLAEQERMKQELAIAHRIQTSLLPAHNPDWPGLEVYGLSKPAREVGGDFYSYLTLGEGLVAIAVGDVSGKGVPGALFMAVAMGVMRAQAPAFRSAAELLQTLNSALYEQMITTQMNVALLYAILESKGNGMWSLHVSNGGLIAPLLLSRAGESEYLNISGLPLGAALYAAYGEIQVELSAGDVLVLCSDGITEAMSADRQLFSFNRLQQSLAHLKECNAAEIAQGLLKAAYEFAGSEDVEDDVTMVVVRLKET